MKELTTDEVEDYLKNKKRIFVKVPIAYDENFHDEQVMNFVKDVENSSGNDIELLIFAENLPEHPLIDDSEGTEKYKMAYSLIMRMHIDVFPFVKIVISLPNNIKSRDLVEKKLEEHKIERAEKSYN